MCSSAYARIVFSGLVWSGLVGCQVTSLGSPNVPVEPADTLADLTPGIIDAPPSVTLDSLLHLTIAVRNIGPRTAGPGWFVRIVLSADASVDATDPILDQFVATRELQPEADDTYLRNMKLPGGLAPGDYFLGSILDVTDAVPEADENNNILIQGAEISILPRSPEARVVGPS